MTSHTAKLSQTEQPIIDVVRPNMLSLHWLLAIFGILPLVSAFALILYAYNSGWFIGLVFGSAWTINIAVFIVLMYWVNKNDDIHDSFDKVL